MDQDVRRIALTGLAVLVFLFVGRAVLGSIFDDEGGARAVALVQRKLVRGGEAGSRPDPAAMSRASAQRTELRDTLAELLPRISYTQPQEFSVPEGASADLAYIQVLRREQQNLVQGARFIGKSVPLDLGMPVPNPTGLEEVRDALRALHVVQRVVSSALAADVAAVDSIRLPKGPRRRAKGGELVRTHAVEFELHGSPRSVHETLRAVVSGEPWLALDEVRIEAQNDDGTLVSCRMTVAAVSLDREQLTELEVLD
ncbi:MAG: hypothetical protein DRQ55_11360 [Planctomycetota bacterium]|nr:MAG: hypothetical protein DRQ55_11360 [Planctomycetota bacterium]